jgi:CHAD domain-containing protein
MPSSPETTKRAASGTRPVAPRKRRELGPPLNPTMACDRAFRVIAHYYLADLTANHEATCKGDSDALHRMRIALTHLRTAILFFSPMVADDERTKIRDELKWLNAELGAVRDIDVAIERLTKSNEARAEAITENGSWNEKAAGRHQHLARVLRSARYRRLVKDTSDWVDNGRWSVKGRKHAEQTAAPITAYSAGKLARWQQKLLRKSRKLLKMSPEKRHRLRLLNKKLTYSIDFFERLFAEKEFQRLQGEVKYLRKAQRSLGQLNDNANARSLAAALKGHDDRAMLHFLSAKREKRLLRSAATAYRKLAALTK